MTRAVLLAIMLAGAASAMAAGTSGSIAGSLTIGSPCTVSSASAPGLPAADCAGGSGAQPRISRQTLTGDARRHDTTQLVTIEW